RKLYESGMSLNAIARLKKVSRRTLAIWKSKEGWIQGQAGSNGQEIPRNNAGDEDLGLLLNRKMIESIKDPNHKLYPKTKDYLDWQKTQSINLGQRLDLKTQKLVEQQDRLESLSDKDLDAKIHNLSYEVERKIKLPSLDWLKSMMSEGHSPAKLLQYY